MSKRHMSVGQQTWALLCKNFLKKWRTKRETLLVWLRVYMSSSKRKKYFVQAAQTLCLHYLMCPIYSISNGLDFFSNFGLCCYFKEDSLKMYYYYMS